LAAKASEKAGEELKKAVSVIAVAASRGIIHKNTASRKISRLTRRVNAL
jgi:small subunit ribosomal protein S20